MKLPADKDFIYEMALMKIISWPMGTWPLQDYNLATGARSVMAILFLMLMLCIVQTEIYLDYGNAEKNLDAFMMIACGVLAISKVACFRFRPTGLIVNFVSAVRDYQELNGEEKRAIVKRHAHMGRMSSVNILFFSYISATLFSMVPMFAGDDHAMDNFNRTRKDQLNYPIPSECTLELLEVPGNFYALVYVGEYFLLLVIAAGNLGSDAMLFGIVFHLCGQVEMLKLDFSRFVEEGADSALRFDALVNRHRHLLALADHLNDAIAFILILQMSSSCLLICTTGFQFILSLKVHNIVMVLKTMIVVSTLLIQAFAYSYVGEYSKNQFEGIGYLAYSSDWYNAPCNLSRNVMFVLMKSKYPVQLKAGNYFPINLETYMSILKTSMSYLSVLRVMVTMKLPADKDFIYEMALMKIISWPMGTWPLQDYNLATGARSVMAILVLMLMLCIVQTEIYLDYGNAEKNLDAFMMLACTVLAISKVACFRFRPTGLIVNFVSAVRDYQELNGEEKRAIVKRHAHMGRMSSVNILLFSYISATLFSMVPMFAGDDHAMDNFNRTRKDQLNYPIPSECTLELLEVSGNFYALVYVGEYFLLLVIAAGNLGSDTMLFGTVFHLCGQVEMLKLDFSRFVEEGADSALRFDALVNRHRHLLALADQLNDAIAFILILQMSSSCLLICTTGFQFILSLKVHNIVMVLKTMIVMSTMLIQTFAYSYVGEYSKNQFEGIGYLAYSSDWYNAPCNLSRNVMFVLMKSKYPVQLKAGNYFPINLETYMSILKTSMSYLSVLRVMVM
ncbi:uncharacterized protein LOC117228198 [Megalopta genalis]|uniref:uncharacterized protein LOC117228198 n=1 Tax=Megalopta genalis TaxID=115081 RepID=UPI003FD1C9DD